MLPNKCINENIVVLNNEIVSFERGSKGPLKKKKFFFWYALIWAADKGHTEIVRRLVAVKDIDVNVQNNEGFTALICAAEQGYVDVVREILEKEDIDVTLFDNVGVSALVGATNNEHYEVVEMLRRHIGSEI